MQLCGKCRDPGEKEQHRCRQDDPDRRWHDALVEKGDSALVIRLAGLAMQPGVQPGADRQDRQQQHERDPTHRDQAVQERNGGAWTAARNSHSAIAANE